jgi:large subunit ribosomal protein L29
MKAKELRDLSVDELKQKEKNLTEEMFRLRFRHATGQLDSTASKGMTKRDLARVKTVLREKEARV